MNILTSQQEIFSLLGSIHRVAVLGIRSEKYSDCPAFYVAAALAKAGLEIIPVSVHEPDVTTILSNPVYRKVADIPGEVDLVNVFRKSSDIPLHLEDILQKKPKAVWFQLGIENQEAAIKLAQAGIKVVQNRCLMVDYQSYCGRFSAS